METLHVEHVGPLESVQIEIKRITIFIGPQGSGKSILAKLINSLSSKDMVDGELPNVERYGLQGLLTDDSRITYQGRPKIDGLPSTRGLLIPWERTMVAILRNSGLPHEQVASLLPPPVINFAEQVNQLTSADQAIAIPFLGNGSGYVGGAGYDAATLMLRLMEKWRSQQANRFIIEEPETNLFPTAQKELVYTLVGGLQEPEEMYRTELVMTTHSPYVLSSLNMLMLAHRIAHRYKTNEPEVEKLVPRRYWINPDEVVAYYVDKGTVRSIISAKTGLIADNELDDISADLADEQDALFAVSRNGYAR